MQVGRHRGRWEEAARQAGMVVGGQKQGGRQRQEKARREEQELRGLQVDRESKQGVVGRQQCMQTKTRSNTWEDRRMYVL
jgi:hypothetical protein